MPQSKQNAIPNPPQDSCCMRPPAGVWVHALMGSDSQFLHIFSNNHLDSTLNLHICTQISEKSYECHTLYGGASLCGLNRLLTRGWWFSRTYCTQWHHNHSPPNADWTDKQPATSITDNKGTGQGAYTQLVVSNSPGTDRERAGSARYRLILHTDWLRCILMHDQQQISLCGHLTQSTKRVTGLGTSKITLEGTVKWSWEDNNNSIRHTKSIPKVQYCEDLHFCLLSPQHLAQGFKNSKGTGATVLGNHINLFWDHRQWCKKIPPEKNEDNVRFTWLAAAYKIPNKAITNYSTKLPTKPA